MEIIKMEDYDSKELHLYKGYRKVAVFFLWDKWEKVGREWVRLTYHFEHPEANIPEDGYYFLTKEDTWWHEDDLNWYYDQLIG